MYLQLAFISSIINAIPAFMPPTWLVLSMYKVNHPALNVIAIALFGVIGSVIGRYVMYKYSKLFGKYVPKKQAINLSYFRKFVGKGELKLYLGTFIYSLSPLPSNFLFIAFGLSGVNLVPVLLGFCLGRLLSYILLVSASFRTFSYFSLFIDTKEARIITDLLGIAFAVLVIFINWEKVYLRTNKLKKKMGNWIRK